MKGSADSFKITHQSDLLVRANYKENLYSQLGFLITVTPSVVDDRPTNGVVLQVGKDINNIEVDDLVYFDKSKGHDIYFDENKDEWYLLLSGEDILGKEK